MKPFVIYTVGRFAVFVGLTAVLWLLGLTGLLAPAIAVVLSVPVSYVLLARQRAALSEEVERRMTGRRSRREQFRARLRGDSADSSSSADDADSGSGA